MQTPRIGVLSGLFAALVLTTTAPACGGNDKSDPAPGKADGKKAPPAADDGKTDDVKAAADGAAAAGGSGGEAAGTAGADGADAKGSTGAAAVDGTAGAEPAATGSGGAGGSGGTADASAGTGGDEADEAGTTGGGPDVKALLKELGRKRTKDARVTEIITELEAAEAEPLEIAKAITKRGNALFATPDRAKAMFELALEKDVDGKYPVPAFELAKQAANIGELDEAKKWLAVVKERKGNKLLKQIDFDPMWEILKDDPDVRALLK